jgi:hypothetical protein
MSEQYFVSVNCFQKTQKLKASFNSIPTTAVIVSRKGQNPLTSNDYHSMAAAVTTHTFVSIIT